jgi:hypothetical protein
MSSLLTDDCGRSGRDAVHDEIVDARLGERKGCDNTRGDFNGEDIPREVSSDCEDATEGGDVEFDMIAIAAEGEIWLP